MQKTGNHPEYEENLEFDPIQRCGQCGKFYPKSIKWRNRNWCPTCGKYVCNDCMSRAFRCPACDTWISEFDMVPVLRMTGVMIGSIFLILSILMVAGGSTRGDIPYNFVVGFIFLGVTFYSHYLIQQRYRSHADYIVNMPVGVIPYEDRPGADNEEVQESWSSHVEGRSFRSNRLMKGTYSDSFYEELKGNWDFPVMTREERQEMTRKVQERGKLSSIGLLVVGMIVLFFGATFGTIQIITCGASLLLLGIIMIWAVLWGKKQVEKDSRVNAKVPWKTVGFVATIQAFNEYLEWRGEYYEEEINDWPLKLMWDNPEHKYIFGDGVSVATLYSESKNRTFGYITLNYVSSDYEHAKDIQQTLDTFLTDRDLIDRIK